MLYLSYFSTDWEDLFDKMLKKPSAIKCNHQLDNNSDLTYFFINKELTIDR